MSFMGLIWRLAAVLFRDIFAEVQFAIGLFDKQLSMGQRTMEVPAVVQDGSMVFDVNATRSLLWPD